MRSPSSRSHGMRRIFLAPLHLLTLVILTWATDARAQDRPDIYILSVGVDDYKAPTNKLKGCIADAQGLAKIWRDQAGKLFNRADVTLLTDAAATHSEILGKMKALEEKGRAGDWLVLVLSGHGGIERDHWGFLTQDNRFL